MPCSLFCGAWLISRSEKKTTDCNKERNTRTSVDISKNEIGEDKEKLLINAWRRCISCAAPSLLAAERCAYMSDGRFHPRATDEARRSHRTSPEYAMFLRSRENEKMLKRVEHNHRKKKKNLKTPVYYGEDGKSSPLYSICFPTFASCLAALLR